MEYETSKDKTEREIGQLHEKISPSGDRREKMAHVHPYLTHWFEQVKYCVVIEITISKGILMHTIRRFPRFC